MKYTIPMTKARKKLNRLVKNVHEGFHEYVITGHGKPKIVIIPFFKYNSLKESNIV